MMAFKLRLNEEKIYDPTADREKEGNVYTIGLPIAVCSPFGADFDGDNMVIHLVPKEAQEETLLRMSPRYMNIYKKNNQPIFVPSHETLNGLCVMSEVKAPDPKELEEPAFYYDSWEKLVKDVELDHTLELDRPILFTGKVGSEEYNYKKTTYGRLKLSKIIDRDIDKIGIFKKDYPDCWNERITSGAGAKLYKFLYPMPDGVEKIRDLQKAALKAVTAAGVVTFSFDTLYADTNTETYQKLRNIADNPHMSDKQKTLLLTEEYKKYSKEVEDSYSSDLKDELARANRVKIVSILDINMPQMIISSAEEVPLINHGSLMEGLSEKDYIYHSVENRALQSIKQSGTPSSGLCLALYKLHRLLERFSFTRRKNQQLYYKSI